MKTALNKTNAGSRRAGFSTLMVVISVSLVVLLLLAAAYRSTLHSIDFEGKVRIRVDHAQKENAFLRSLVSLAAKGAADSMRQQGASGVSDSSWEAIIRQAMLDCNAINSQSGVVAGMLPSEQRLSSNTGDLQEDGFSLQTLVNAPPDWTNTSGSDLVMPGIGTSRPGYPAVLTSSNTSSQEAKYPLISRERKLSNIGEEFTIHTYPNINFGYLRQGERFIAKRNWWAFDVDYSSANSEQSGLAPVRKRYVLSLYEIPSQMPISVAAVAALGSYRDGRLWNDGITIEGAIVASAANVTAGLDTNATLATRGDMSMQSGARVGEFTMGNDSAQKSGVRESYVASRSRDEFMPVSSAGDSGRVAFIPINPGWRFYQLDFAKLSDISYPKNINQITGADSWEWYSRGALQCPMRVLITEYQPNLGTRPQTIEVYLRKGNTTVKQVYTTDATQVGGEVKAWPIGDSNFPFRPNNPNAKINAEGLDFDVQVLPGWLTSQGASIEENNAVVFNVVPNETKNIKNQMGSWVPELNAGEYLSASEVCRVVLTNCRDFDAFTKGFSIVSDMMVVIAEDLNIINTRPFSMFSPAVRYRDNDESLVDFTGQLGGLNLNPTDPAAVVRPISFGYGMTRADANTTQDLDPNKVKARLVGVNDPDELPPINMMNWLLVVEQVQE